MSVTCRFSGRSHFWAIKESITGEEFATLFMERYMPLHGIPNQLISDRDPRFMSSFWDTVTKRLGLQHSMSTTDHPQTDGLQERQFRTFNQMMRCFVNIRQDDWEDLLPIMEFRILNVYQISLHLRKTWVIYRSCPSQRCWRTIRGCAMPQRRN